ncbi:Gfo/Idh/MocA family protein [Rhodococcoides fascians]|uniref:Gfo/Idh/MocA family protein n=1 Tax=Rhodococcoides fascians TaxID=1828 RepID=UPI00056AAEF3|nr:Gfo/Idh/MocA family oxidoreductase [Rhodococcus fascians]
MTASAAKLRVGIIGASPGRSWASRAHIPAIAAVDGMALTSVATSRPETAAQAAEQFGARNAYVGTEDLVTSDDVDLVIVAVKVPHHRDMVEQALAAGKHVYCEWPLAVNVEEAEHMTALHRGPSRVAVGLQARSSPTLRYMRDLIHNGFIGTLESVSVTAFSARGSKPVPPAMRYLYDQARGGNFLTIEAGHLLDAMAFLLGEPVDGRSTSPIRRPELADTEGGFFRPDTPDTLTAIMTTPTGAPLTVHVAQGVEALQRIDISIIGSNGALTYATTTPGGIQIAASTLQGASGVLGSLKPLETPASYYHVALTDQPAAINVAEAFSAFAQDIATGTKSVPDFDDALARHRMLADLYSSPIF